MAFEVVFYRRMDGTEPVREFMYSLRPKLRAKMERDLQVLERENVRLREPFAKHLEAGLFELRISQAGDIARAFYFFFDGAKIVVTSGFIKKSAKTPRREIDRALRFKRDWEERRPE